MCYLPGRLPLCYTYHATLIQRYLCMIICVPTFNLPWLVAILYVTECEVQIIHNVVITWSSQHNTNYNAMMDIQPTDEATAPLMALLSIVNVVLSHRARRAVQTELGLLARRRAVSLTTRRSLSWRTP